MTADTWAGRCNGCGHEVARAGCQCPKPGLGGAEVLRRAAALARKRAETATPGPWQVGQDVDSGQRFIYDERWTELAEVAEWSRWLGNPEHIASWHPAVALAVADWLDYAAETAAGWERIGVHDPDRWAEPTRRAVLIATAYLGESA